jgi:hypothetical protein
MAAIRSLAQLLKPGDYLVLLTGLILVSWLFLLQVQKSPGQFLIVRAQGQVVAELPLNSPRMLNVAGARGISVVEIGNGRARVAGDPGPRQLCVKQGWISRAGDALLCLANQVSLEIPGSTLAFDSLTY